MDECFIILRQLTLNTRSKSGNEKCDAIIGFSLGFVVLSNMITNSCVAISSQIYNGNPMQMVWRRWCYKLRGPGIEPDVAATLYDVIV